MVQSAVHRDRRVHSGSRFFTTSSLGVVGFILDSVGSLGRAYGSSGLYAFACFHFPTGSRGFTLAHLGVLGFITVSVGSLPRM